MTRWEVLRCLLVLIVLQLLDFSVLREQHLLLALCVHRVVYPDLAVAAAALKSTLFKEVLRCASEISK